MGVFLESWLQTTICPENAGCLKNHDFISG